ncbi:hypothetical protein [Magnetospirillum sp. UT-4]|uniref:hypothetical protein n=1 Tax=Magnetospirillum sp. UT-4 TaxID=2681467 RepID=UPI00137F6D2F|nr:hypothetical protein [Magnetospirillum sp. UT-4]CAA7613223.1 conserved hypothetical protein [Magnetospirillum sp. UT-4]
MAEAVGGETETVSVQGKSETGIHCRSMVGMAMRGFLELVEMAAGGKPIGVEQVRRLADSYLNAGESMTTFYAKGEARCEQIFALAAIERQRRDQLGRLIAEGFAHLLDQPGSGIERKHLGQFFTAIRLMLGDELHDQLKARCKLIAETHRGPDNLIDWPAFHADPRAETVLDQVLVAIARSFRRFDPRMDWFLILMHSSPSSVSTSSNAFVPKRPEDKASRTFSELQAVRLFEALFARVRPDTFDEERTARFVERFGSDPQSVFGPFFVALTGLGNRVGR